MNTILDSNSKALALVVLLQNELAATNQEVLLLTLELEQRVADRTKELSISNASLKKEVAERRQAEDEIHELNGSLNRRASELEIANKNLEAFAFSVSHDLRAPIRHIDGYAHILRESLEDNLTEAATEHIEAIFKQARKMSQLIDDLLQFSRVSRVQMTRDCVDLNQLVYAVVSEMRPDVNAHNVIWEVGVLPIVEGDEHLLRYAVSNLVSNAIKYSSLREPAKIEIGCLSEDADQTTVFVKDNGVGFDQQYSKKLFEVFERLHTEKEFEGTGIGLANVRSIIERHGGRVWGEGVVGEGATFSFSLPRKSKA